MWYEMFPFSFSYSRSSVWKSYHAVYGNRAVFWLWQVWHPCLNQCECISGRKPSASFSTAAAFIVCSCRQIRESDTPAVTCGKYVCVLWQLYSFLSSCHSFIHDSRPHLVWLHEWVYFFSACGCLLHRETKTMRGERKWMTQLKVIERSKASIKMSSVGCHTHKYKDACTHTHTHTRTYSSRDALKLAGRVCVRSINSSASSLMLFLNQEPWLTSPRAKLRSNTHIHTHTHTQQTVPDFPPDSRLLGQSWITVRLLKHSSFLLSACVCL